MKWRELKIASLYAWLPYLPVQFTRLVNSHSLPHPQHKVGGKDVATNPDLLPVCGITHRVLVASLRDCPCKIHESSSSFPCLPIGLAPGHITRHPGATPLTPLFPKNLLRKYKTLHDTVFLIRVLDCYNLHSKFLQRRLHMANLSAHGPQVVLLLLLST